MIDNKNSYFYKVLRDNITDQSELFIQCNSITFHGLAKFLTDLNGYKQMCVLVGNENRTLKYFTAVDNDVLVQNELLSVLKAKSLVEAKSNKAFIKSGFCGLNVVIVKNGDQYQSYLFTQDPLNTQVLGYAPSEMNIIITPLPPANSEDYYRLFKNTWNVSSDIVAIPELIEHNINSTLPKWQYLYSLKHLFADYERIEQYEKIEQTGFFKSKVWNLLYNFQKDAVLGAIDKIEKYGGCIIADSVGLGKTFEALGVIKYYQNRNKDVLVLCPKRLYENWAVYRNNDRRNILQEDRLNYDLLFHTDLSRYKGLSNGVDLEHFNWENADLIVIDESHNFRNNSPSKDHTTRYQRLMEDIIKKGVKTKVLMLSATPVNNKLKDLKNQLYFITEDDDQGLANTGISSINLVLKQAQKEFNQWLDRPDDSRDNLIDKLDGRYFKLLDMMTIARSRKHIQKYYDTEAIGQFPNRLAPINKYAEIDTKDEFPDIGTINNEIIKLNLAQYKPTKYILPGKRQEYRNKYDHQIRGGNIFSQESREESLIGLMRVNFLKRLESSIYSFTKTMNKVSSGIAALINQIDHFEQNRGQLTGDYSILDDFDVDELDPEVFIGENVVILMQDIDRIKFKNELQQDLSALNKILAIAKQVTPERDRKIQILKEVIRDKVENPINPDNKKVLVFSAFADTAGYLYDHIAEWARNELGIFTGLVTGGSSQNKTNLPGCSNHFNNIIINFSPISKQRPPGEDGAEEEIDLLIGTDCISEGQNLQDCDYLINYDIHWNPVRIVQRFGRIDRIGSKNTDIQLVNFWPNLDLNAYINLVEKVKGRMVILNVSATGDEDLVNTDSFNGELDYRTKQLEKLQNQVVDLEDLQTHGISITDLTFNDFKVDLDHLTPTEVDQLKHLMPGFMAVAQNNSTEEKGVVFCVKHLDYEEEYIINNPLYPYCLVFVSNQGEIVYNVKQCKNTLDLLRSSCMITSYDAEELRSGFMMDIRKPAYQEHLQGLFAKVIDGIQGNADLSVASSVFEPGATVTPLAAADHQFVLINYVVIQ